MTRGVPVIILAPILVYLSCCSAPETVGRREKPAEAAVVSEDPFAEVRLALKGGDCATAVALLEGMGSSRGERGQWLTWMGEAQAVCGNFEEAAETAEAAVRQAPGKPGPLLLKAKLYWIDGRFDEAAEMYAAALDAQPEIPEAVRGLGLCLIQSGLYARAVGVLRDAAALLPSDVQVLNNLGVALASSGQLEEARGVLQDAATRARDDATVVNNLADVLLRLGDVEEAGRRIDDLVRLDPARANAARLQKDLVTVSVVVAEACRKERRVITRVEEAFLSRGWTKQEASDSLRRVSGDPMFDAMVRRAAAECP